MKVQTIKIKSFKALQNIEQEINGNNVYLMGENGVGKSSFIQFIQIALGMQSNIPPNANGEGVVITDKDGKKYTFKVKIKEGKSVVEIISPDGTKDSRKGALASLVGAIEFDIDEFVELSKSTAGRKKMIEVFKSFLSDEVKSALAAHEASNKAKYDERTDVNRQIKTLEAEISAHPMSYEIDLDKFQSVDVTKVYSELKAANEQNEEVKAVKDRIDRRAEDNAKKTSEISELQMKIDRLKNEVAENNEKNKAAAEWLASDEGKIIDVTELETKIAEAGAKNEKHNQAKSLKEKRTMLEKLRGESEDLTVLIETGKQSIADAIRDMDGPVEGLSFDEDTLIYNGLPVNPDTLSASEIMELGVKLKMAENPDLGILFIQRGESLGAKRLKEIQDLAARSGWQMFMEQVERGTEKLKIEIVEAESVEA